MKYFDPDGHRIMGSFRGVGGIGGGSIAVAKVVAHRGKELGNNVKTFFTKLVKKIFHPKSQKPKVTKGKNNPKVNAFDINNPNSFKNSNVDDVEKYLDENLDGFTKRALKKGNGVRYFDGKGKSYQVNYSGYENSSDAVHGGPYFKTTVGGDIIRVPLIK